MSFHVLIMACEQSRWSFIRFRMIPLSHHSLTIAFVHFFLQLLPQLIAVEFRIRQILQPAGTPAFPET